MLPGYSLTLPPTYLKWDASQCRSSGLVEASEQPQWLYQPYAKGTGCVWPGGQEPDAAPYWPLSAPPGGLLWHPRKLYFPILPTRAKIWGTRCPKGTNAHIAHSHTCGHAHSLWIMLSQLTVATSQPWGCLPCTNKTFSEQWKPDTAGQPDARASRMGWAARKFITQHSRVNPLLVFYLPLFSN